MRIKFDFVHKIYYKFDRDIPQSIIEEYCHDNDLTMEEFKANPDKHAFGLANYISTNYEHLGDELTEEGQDGLIFNAVLE